MQPAVVIDQPFPTQVLPSVDQRVFKTVVMWGLLALSSIGGVSDNRSLGQGMGAPEPTSTNTSDSLSFAEREVILNIVSRLSEKHGVPLATIREHNPSGYLEPRLISLIKNFDALPSFSEFLAIGKPSIPFLEEAALKTAHTQKGIESLYRLLGEIGGNEAASSILRVLFWRAEKLNAKELKQDLSAVYRAMASTNSELGNSLIKEVLKSTTSLSDSDGMALREFTVNSFLYTDRGIQIEELEEIVLNKSNPLQLRHNALTAQIGVERDSERLQRLVVAILKDEKDPLFPRALMIAMESARHLALPFVVSAVFSEEKVHLERVSAVRALGVLGAQRYVPKLIELLSKADNELSTQILKTVVTIGTAENVNQLMQKWSELKGIKDQFPCREFTKRLLDSPRLQAATRPALEIILREVFKPAASGRVPILENDRQASILLETIVKYELGKVLNLPRAEFENYANSINADEYLKSVAKLIFQLGHVETSTFRPEVSGMGLLAPFASKEALHSLALNALSSREAKFAVWGLIQMEDPSVKEALTGIARDADTNSETRLVISNFLKLSPVLSPNKTKTAQDPAPEPTSDQDADVLSKVGITPSTSILSSSDDLVSSLVEEGLNQELSVDYRASCIKKVIVLTETQSKELLPLVTDPAEAIRVAAACTLAAYAPKNTFLEADIAAVDATLIEVLKKSIRGDYTSMTTTISPGEIERAVLAWKSPSVIAFLCLELETSTAVTHRKIASLLNPLLKDESDFQTFLDYSTRKIVSLPRGDAVGIVLAERLALLRGMRGLGLDRPFRFSDIVQKALIQDMKPSASDRRPVVILCFAEADHNQAANSFNSQIEEMIRRGFRVLGMEPGSCTELEAASIRLKKILDASEAVGAAHIFQFGHGQTDSLQLSEEGDINDSYITSSDSVVLPNFSKLLAPDGGVTLLSCSTGGQIAGEHNLLSYYRDVVFPQAAEGQIRAPVLPTFLSGVTITFSESGQSIEDVTFSVQTNAL